MITDIPHHSEFYESGKELLAFAWDITSTLLVQLEQADWLDGKDQDEYWQISKRHLNTSASLLQQGIEFILKGKITEI